MILSVCIALFITNSSQSDLLSCPPRAAETRALLGSSSRAATTPRRGRGKGEFGPSKPHPWFLRPWQTSKVVGFMALPKRCVYKNVCSIYLAWWDDRENSDLGQVWIRVSQEKQQLQPQAQLIARCSTRHTHSPQRTQPVFIPAAGPESPSLVLTQEHVEMRFSSPPCEKTHTQENLG